jgi:crotonobetainyl-CoA:carnitine CoA-transferase CaiB-like acyl-CoA transferase
MAPHGIYRCRGDDDWVSIACATEDEWRALCGVVGGGLAADPRFASAPLRKQNEDVLEEAITAWTSVRDRFDVTDVLQRVRVAAFPAMSPKDLAHDAHLEARGFSARLPHPEIGPRQHGGIPWILSNGPNGVRAPAPCIGADTEAVLGDLLGYSADEIRQMREQGVLA